MLSLEKMVSIYVSDDLDERTWDMFNLMCGHGLIKSDVWEKFYEKCHDWTLSCDERYILNYSGDILYRRDGFGSWVKC